MARGLESATSRVLLVVATALASACAGATPPVAARPDGATVLSAAHEARSTRAAHELLVAAASCWFGGLWGDVQGEAPAAREMEAVKRCESLARRVFGTDDRARYEQVRAFESVTINEVVAKVAALADADPVDAPRKDVLVALTRTLADAQRETMLARRAGHRILRDVEREPEKLSGDEAAALPALEAANAFDALYHVDAGGLQREAHAFALLVALDRMNIAQQIPLHLKPYPLVEPFHAIFGAPIPDLPHDASKPLPRAGWLTYLTAVASAAGHPVTQTSAPPQIRHERAVQGILAGISDKLKTDAEGAEPPFSRIVQYVIRDLDAVAKAADGASGATSSAL